MKVYVVIGNNGESYEDYRDWVSGVFADKELAELHIDRQPDLFAEDYAKIQRLWSVMEDRMLEPIERMILDDLTARWPCCENTPTFTIEEHNLVGM